MVIVHLDVRHKSFEYLVRMDGYEFGITDCSFPPTFSAISTYYEFDSEGSKAASHLMHSPIFALLINNGRK